MPLPQPVLQQPVQQQPAMPMQSAHSMMGMPPYCWSMTPAGQMKFM